MLYPLSYEGRGLGLRTPGQGGGSTLPRSASVPAAPRACHIGDGSVTTVVDRGARGPTPRLVPASHRWQRFAGTARTHEHPPHPRGDEGRSSLVTRTFVAASDDPHGGAVRAEAACLRAAYPKGGRVIVEIDERPVGATFERVVLIDDPERCRKLLTGDGFLRGYDEGVLRVRGDCIEWQGEHRTVTLPGVTSAGIFRDGFVKVDYQGEIGSAVAVLQDRSRGARHAFATTKELEPRLRSALGIAPPSAEDLEVAGARRWPRQTAKMRAARRGPGSPSPTTSPGSPRSATSSTRCSAPRCRSSASASATSCSPTPRGGEVQRAAGGWGVGVHRIEIDRVEPWMDPEPDGLSLLFMHQDQVTTPPPGAEVLGHANHCEVAMLRVGPTMLGLQAHPEFGPPYVEALLERRRAAIGEERATVALASLREPTDEHVVAAWLARFLG